MCEIFHRTEQFIDSICAKSGENCDVSITLNNGKPLNVPNNLSNCHEIDGNNRNSVSPLQHMNIHFYKWHSNLSALHLVEVTHFDWVLWWFSIGKEIKWLLVLWNCREISVRNWEMERAISRRGTIIPSIGCSLRRREARHNTCFILLNVQFYRYVQVIMIVCAPYALQFLHMLRTSVREWESESITEKSKWFLANNSIC